MSVTLTLKRDDPAAFDAYRAAVYDPRSALYHHFLNVSTLAQRFGPSADEYRALRRWLQYEGLALTAASADRLTITAHGTRAQVERAFAVNIGDYAMKGTTRRWYANINNPALPARFASHVGAISGFSNFADPQPASVAISLNCLVRLKNAGSKSQADAILAACEHTQQALSNLADDVNFITDTLGIFGGLQSLKNAGKFYQQSLKLAERSQTGNARQFARAVTLSGKGSANLWDFITSSLGLPVGGKGLAPWVGRLTNTTTAGKVGMGLITASNPLALQTGSHVFDLGQDWNAWQSAQKTFFGPASGSGGSNAAQPQFVTAVSTTPFAAAASTPLPGTGQTIGLLEFDAFDQNDVLGFLNLLSEGSHISQLSVVPVNGGISTPGSGTNEVLLDIDTVMALAPGANVKVYEVPFSGHIASYTQALNAMINGGVNIISISWASCEDQVSQADAEAVDALLKTAAAAGISVFAGTGDTGSTCLDGSPDTISMPADSPDLTAVGATSLPAGGFATGGAYSQEAWWGADKGVIDSGESGYGVSRYFARPAYQDGFTTSAMRSIPDVSVLADPLTGLRICDADGCPSDQLFGGTSMAAPEFAAIAATLNQAQGKPLGFFNPLLYGWSGTAALHGPAAMAGPDNDFSHVGLGSPNVDALNRLLNGQKVPGVPSAARSLIAGLAATSSGQIDFLPSDGSLTIATPADGSTAAGVAVTLVDADGNTVPGKAVTLAATASDGSSPVITPSGPVTTDSNGVAVFRVTDSEPDVLSFTATDTTDNVQLTNTAALVFDEPPATAGELTVAPPSVTADGSSTATVTVTLQDANGQPLPNKAIELVQGPGHAVVSGPTPALTDASGRVQFTVTDDHAETMAYYADDLFDGQLPIPGSGATVDFSNAVASDCSGTPTAGPNFTLTPFAWGFPAGQYTPPGGPTFVNCPGPGIPIFQSSGQVLVADDMSGSIYSLLPSGGSASPDRIIASPGVGNTGYVVALAGRDGNFYETNISAGTVTQVDPDTGATIRTLASGYQCPSFLAMDPISGDLFFDGACDGGGTDSNLYRISNPYGSDPTVSVYADLAVSPTQESVGNGAIVFAPDGTIYVNTGSGDGNFTDGYVQVVSGTNSPHPGTVSPPIPGLLVNTTGMAIGETNADGSAKTLLVVASPSNDPGDGTDAGSLETVNVVTGAVDRVLMTGSGISVGTVGPDGCDYQPVHHVIYKLMPSSGPCSLTPATPSPALVLAPASVTPDPGQGTLQSFTATLQNVAASADAGVPVLFSVAGPNAQTRVVKTDASGQATLSYTAVNTGTDSVEAVAAVPASSASASPAPVFSNTAHVTLVAGAGVTTLSLNASPTVAAVNQPVTLVAQLIDQSTMTPVPGQRVQLSAGGQSCEASTDSNGNARCAVTPAASGASTLKAAYQGESSTYTSAVAAKQFNVSAVPSGGLQPPPPAGESGSIHAGTGGGTTGPWILGLLGLLALWRRRRRALAKPLLMATAAGLLVLPATAGAFTLSTHLRGVYVGTRLGVVNSNLDGRDVTFSLAAQGYHVTASSASNVFGGTVYAGMMLTPMLGAELDYSHSVNQHFAVGGALPVDPGPLLHAVAERALGYNNHYGASLRLVLPGQDVSRFVFVPRAGLYYWNDDASVLGWGAAAHAHGSGIGYVLGVSLQYRVWRGLSVGGSVDYQHSSFNRRLTLFGGVLEWAFLQGFTARARTASLGTRAWDGATQ